MIVLEAGLIAILTVLLFHASLTDLKSGTIRNMSIVSALIPGLLCAFCYYLCFAADCLPAYAVNVALGCGIGVLLYALGIWGAGDSKLLAATILLFPARLYCFGEQSVASCFLLICLIFVTAFFFVAWDTLYLVVRQRERLRKPRLRIDWRRNGKSFLFLFLLIGLLNTAFDLLLPEQFRHDSILLGAIHFVQILIGLSIENKVSWTAVLIMGAIWLLFGLLGYASFHLSQISWSSLLLAAMLLAFRQLTNPYNYKTIPVTELREGMILSAASVLLLNASRMSGLPSCKSEDLHARLTKEEVDAVVRWSKTHGGQDTITVVRKIPFALFVALGTLFFTILEVTWR